MANEHTYMALTVPPSPQDNVLALQKPLPLFLLPSQDNILADLPLGLAKLKHVLELLDLSHNRLQQV